MMKATKALKKLAKIEVSLSDLIERFSASDHTGQEFLESAKASVIRAKETVSLQVSSRTAKNPNVKHGDEPASKTISEPSKPKRKLSAAGRKAIIAATKKRWALKRAEAAKTATKNAAPTRKKGTTKRAAIKAAPAEAAIETAPVKKVVQKSAAQKTAPAPAQTVAQAAGQ
jgi:hypothetical protein